MTTKLSSWLRKHRLSTPDPRTGKPYTQARLAEELSVSPSKIAAWERGAIASVSPADAHRLSRLLRREEREIVLAMGYKLDDLSASGEEHAFLSAFRQLPAVYQKVEMERLRILARLLRHSGVTG
jgi:transcriptional regulator with XRE-family HTH domain